jgi:putative FmdB family regulatory protein
MKKTMPMYEYKCKCGQVFERIVKLSDKDRSQKCNCGLQAERIPISRSSFQLKGNWFKTTGEY